ncbi:MAG: alpha/beta hydrolase [Pseudomonadota bacterium]
MSRLLAGLCFGVLVVFVFSHIVDARRTVPAPPQTLSWWPDAGVEYVSVGGVTTRFVSEGSGPDLVLLHTFSTELGQFRKIAEKLSETFTVWALDLPGFGYADLPDGPLSAQFFANYVRSFMAEFSIMNPMVVGESIGGTIALMLATDDEVGLSGALALNPIGYTDAPLARSGRVASVFSRALRTPIISDFALRVRNARVTKAILEGGLYDPTSLSDTYFADLITIQQRPEFPKAQKLFAASNKSWVQALDDIEDVVVPTRILWGETDWSTKEEREAVSMQLAGARVTTISASGHFMTLDQPEAILSAVNDLAKSAQ